MIYPEDSFKFNWDTFMSLVLMFTCLITPYNMAFRTDDYSVSSITIEAILDITFILDLIFNFMTAFYDQDLNLVESRKVSI